MLRMFLFLLGLTLKVMAKKSSSPPFYSCTVVIKYRTPSSRRSYTYRYDCGSLCVPGRARLHSLTALSNALGEGIAFAVDSLTITYLYN